MGVTLRKINQEDLEMIMNWRMAPEVTKYMYTDPVITLDMQKEWYEKIIINKELEKYWIIQLDNTVDVGLLSINNIDYHNKQASWAYYIASTEARGKGLGRILECNIYDYVLNELNLNKLWCEVFEFNDKVISIHEKFGSKIEGKFIDHIYKNGEYHNVIRMAILKSDWVRLKESQQYDELTIEHY
jgi:UDP-4-amino-4,6-dideoxy-N-acetyl-beta-L-altrosamine N-acetyltransferase